MKQIFAFLILLLPISLVAQQQNTDSAFGKNIIKLNLGALAFRNISVQYERSIGPKMSIAATLRYMPDGEIPFKSAIRSLIDEEDTERQLDNTRVGNIAFMPELRFYLGKKGVFNGFYLAPFASIARYDAALEYIYQDLGIDKTIFLDGGVTTLTGGFMMGAQWKLSNKLYFDWWILGPNFGMSDGKISGKKSLTPTEQNSLRQELEELDIPLTKTTYTVDANGAVVNFKGPWGGVRSGLCLGFRF